MIKLEVIRSYLGHGTVGYIQLPDGVELKTLEKAWLDNEPNVSCIPEGTYLVKRDSSGRWQYYSIQNVPNRTFIEIHPANTTEQLAGCLALGVSSLEDGSLIRSQEAVNYFVETVGDNDFMLTFRSYNPNTDGQIL